MRKRKGGVFLIAGHVMLSLLMVLLCNNLSFAETPVVDKVGVLITGWGMPAGYNFGYAWASPDLAQIGDKTEFDGQPCKIGHVGVFPYQSHVNFIPWAILFYSPDTPDLYDYYGVYKYENGVYVNASQNPSYNLLPNQIPAGKPITPLKNVKEQGIFKYPVDPRDGSDYLAGWYQIGNFTNQFSNGVHDFKESMPAIYTRYYGILGVPLAAVDPNEQHPAALAQDAYLEQLLYNSFGDRIDIRYGFYSPIPGYTKRMDDAAEEFANEGFTKMLIARETTDNNRYANDFMSGYYVKERLCEINKLDSMQIQQTRQVGRTPEFNTMNVHNLKPFIEAYPEGSTIGIIYTTRGLPWGKDESPTGNTDLTTAHPWTKEIYHENAYLNYLSLKKALKVAFGSRYNLVFTKGGIESDLRADNYFTYAVNKANENGGVFISVRDAINTLKGYNIRNILIIPGHWNYDNLDTILTMKEVNKLPFTPKADILANKFDYTHCEDATGNVVTCGSVSAVTTITAGPSYTLLPEEFATAYYVVLRGTLERFGLYPSGEELVMGTSQLVTKLAGGTVEVTSPSSPIRGSKIQIPADPYPDRPESFHWYVALNDQYAIPINDPADTNDCMWEDTTITIGHRDSIPHMLSACPAGPAVHFGPYRTFFNRDVTITIPFNSAQASGKTLKAYIYNHVAKDWDVVDPESVDTVNSLLSFKTKILGLFRAGTVETCPQTVIDIVRFQAKGKLLRIAIKWETASEIDTAGYNIYRADSADGNYAKINGAQIPAKGSATEGAAYKFVDWSVESGKTYYYKLQDVDTSGTKTFHDQNIASAEAWFLFKKNK
jgi:hypothetical protein